MVRIVADTIYDESVTITHTDTTSGGTAYQDITNNLPQLAPNGLSGFAYIETIKYTIEHDPGINFNRTGGNSSTRFEVYITSEYIFNGIDLFGDISRQQFRRSRGSQTHTGPFEEIATADIYTDTPATVKPVFETGNGGFFAVNGTQTIETTVTIEAIGRSP